MDTRLPEEDRQIICLEYVLYKTEREVADAFMHHCSLQPSEVGDIVKSFGFRMREKKVSPRHRKNIHINSFNMELLKQKGW